MRCKFYWKFFCGLPQTAGTDGDFSATEGCGKSGCLCYPWAKSCYRKVMISLLISVRVRSTGLKTYPVRSVIFRLE